MNEKIEVFIGFLICYCPTLVFLGLKWGLITRNGWLYNWTGSEPHTLWFLLILSINTNTFMKILQRKLRLFV